MGALDDTLRRIEAHMDQSNKLLYLMYQRTQLVEADKTPGRGEPYTVNLQNPILPSPQALPLLPRNPSRNQLGIINYGPSDILFHTANFDPLTILTEVSDPS